MNIFIIGGFGFIGNATAKELYKNNNVIIGIDKSKIYSNIDRNLLNLKTYTIDFTNKKKIIDYLNQNDIELILNLSGSTGILNSSTNNYKFEEDYKKNHFLISCLAKTKVKFYLFSSSSAVYKDNFIFQKLTEKSELMPLSSYAKNKIRSEKDIKKILPKNSIKFCILRYFNVEGSYKIKHKYFLSNKDTLITNICKAIILNKNVVNIYNNNFKTRDCTSVRDFIHVKDIALVNKKIVDYFLLGGKSFTANVGTGNGFSVLEIVKIFEKIYKIKLKVNKFSTKKKVEAGKLISNNNFIYKKINWKPKYSNIKNIIRSTYKAIKSKGSFESVS
jgi:UDP-glucose 4-epimerase